MCSLYSFSFFNILLSILFCQNIYIYIYIRKYCSVSLCVISIIIMFAPTQYFHNKYCVVYIIFTIHIVAVAMALVVTMAVVVIVVYCSEYIILLC